MTKDFPVVCISGSMRFYERMLQLAQDLTFAGYIVLMPHANKHNIDTKDNIVNAEKEAMLDAMHMVKISMCSILYVVCPNQYIGESTRKEIEYAVRLGRTILMKV